MDFIQHDGNANHKDQAGEEAQRIRGDMRRYVRPEKQRQRMVNQVDKQRSINEIGDATGFKIQQTMPRANTTLTIHRPISIVITLSVSYIHASPLP